MVIVFLFHGFDSPCGKIPSTESKRNSFLTLPRLGPFDALFPFTLGLKIS